LIVRLSVLLILVCCASNGDRDNGPLCAGLRNPNLIVLVRAADGQTEVCNAIVELLDGTGGVVRQIPRNANIGLGDACSYEYMGLNGRFGVRARKDASTSDTQQIDVAADECGQPTKPRATITLTLMP
jgi:hypothetical protein